MTRGARNWRADADALKLAGQSYVNGKLVSAQTGATFGALNPATGKTLVDVASCEAADVDIAVKSARKAFESGVWSNRTPTERKKVLQRFAELMSAHADE